MNKRTFARIGVPAAAVGMIAAVAAFVACSSSTTPSNPTDAGMVGNACAVPPPATFPNAECESSDNTTCNATSTCAINEAVCGSKSTCLPMADNTGKKVIDLRLRRLTVLAPAALAKGFIQKSVLDQGISLAADGNPAPDPQTGQRPTTGGAPTPTCGEHGDGAFNWLVRIDKTAGTFTTGGAPPSPDPFGMGYCFVNGMIAGGATVGPITEPYTMSADGKFSSNPVDNLNVPIFVHGNVNNVVVLPLHKAQFKDVLVSPDGNCIGSFNYGALDSMCYDARENCSKWHTDGSLGGYITLEEADKVQVQDLHATLCVLLTSSTGVDPMMDGSLPACKRDGTGKIAFQGDYCAATGPGGCQDSFWLSATFAASAVKINDGSTTPLCSGSAPPLDGGPG